VTGDDIPFLAVGNDELAGSPTIKKGDMIEHQHTDGTWETATIEYGDKVLENGEKVKSSLLAFYTLKNGETYLAGLGGKMLGRKNLRRKL